VENRWLESLQRDGYSIIPSVFTPNQVDAITKDLGQALAMPGEEASAIRNPEGITFAARNVMSLWPPARAIWRQEPLLEIFSTILGPKFGLVRVLFFDKPPEQSWCLPWHKDLTIAVQDNGKPSAHFQKPTRKAGIPHVEASLDVLRAMLTARIHLDDVTEENGPLKVLPGSHLAGKVMPNDESPAQAVLVHRGDVLLMRPLLAHSSAGAFPNTTRHRRVLHLEFAASEMLPDGYAWHDFIHA